MRTIAPPCVENPAAAHALYGAMPPIISLRQGKRERESLKFVAAFARPFAAFVLVLLVCAAALAQQPASGSPLLDNQRKALSQFQDDIAKIERTLSASGAKDEALAAQKLSLDTIARSILQLSVEFRPRLSEIGSRLTEIGDPPSKDEAPERPEVIAERQRLTAEKAEINAFRGEQEALALKASQLSAKITGMRRELFSAELFERVPLREAMNTSLVSEFGSEATSLWRKVKSWARFAANFKLKSVLSAAFLALLLAYLLLFGGRRYLDLYDVSGDNAETSGLRRITQAFWSTVIPSAAVAIFLSVTYMLFDQFGVLTGAMPRLFSALFNVIFVVFFVNRLASAILRPKAPSWRLVPVTSSAAGILSTIATALAVVVGLDFLLSVGADIEASSLSLTVARSLLATVIVGLLILVIAQVKPFEDENGVRKPWPRLLRVALIVTGLFPIAASLFGYIGLARFISQQVVVNGAFLITMYVGFLTAGAISAVGAFARTHAGRWLHARFGLADEALDQAGMLAGIAINILVLLIGVPIILLQFGFQTGDLRSWFYGIMSEIRIGSISISLIGVMTGIIVFVAVYVLTRWFQRWLDGTVMARGKVDPGVRNSIRTAVGYAGFALAALFGVSAAGINLASLALVAGALSLGIGFGLQNIVSNFVSGLILLAERPFKVGDWIEAGPVSGTVKRINVRATEIETFQRQTIIMPNSELINAAVGNWTHRNKLARGDIRIGVAYGTDPKMVRSILLEIAQAHPKVLKNPEPFVIFANFGESSLDFELRFFLADVADRQEVATEIRFAVVEEFDARGIEIPFPQRDLNITRQSVEAIARALGSSASEPQAPAKPARKPKAASKKPAVADAPRRRARRYKELD